MFVFDSSTLIILAKVELLDTFLQDYEGKVIIPEAVYRESTVKRSFDALLIEKRVAEGKIQLHEMERDSNEHRLGQQLKKDFLLDDGESEAVALAFSSKATLATDDKNAITACKQLHLEFATAIHFLIRAKEKKLLTAAQAERKLGEIQRYGRYSKTIIDDARKRISG